MDNNPYIRIHVTCACPNCGKVKGDNNHWFICHMPEGRFSVKPWDDDAIREEDNIIPLCGDACVIKMLSMYLSGQKSRRPS
jgi:hypothetical protein